jgi:hypothetical protein
LWKMLRDAEEWSRCMGQGKKWMISYNRIIEFQGRNLFVISPFRNFKRERHWTPVAHACNPSYSGGKNQVGCASKPAWISSLPDTILKIPFTKKSWWSGSRCRPWV